jgi:hypothetical protein
LLNFALNWFVYDLEQRSRSIFQLPLSVPPGRNLMRNRRFFPARQPGGGVLDFAISPQSIRYKAREILFKA